MLLGIFGLIAAGLIDDDRDSVFLGFGLLDASLKDCYFGFGDCVLLS